MTPDRLLHCLVQVAQRFGTNREEFRRLHHPQADMALDALLSRGYLTHNPGDGMMAVSPKGNRKLEAEVPAVRQEEQDDG